MKPHIVAIIQARMAASRLPGKVLLEIEGRPMLAWVVERTRRAATIDEVVVATTDSPADDAVEDYCLDQGYACFRGSQYDVLDRYYQAALQYKADVIVRITADCPLIDPGVMDATVGAFLGLPVDSDLWSSTDRPYDFVANRLPPPWKRTYPIGLDTEVCSIQALETAWAEAKQPHQREHVMPFFYEQPERFRILHLTHDPDFGDLRWTVDTPADMELVRHIAARFQGRIDFSWREVLDLFTHQPQLAEINSGVQAKHYRQTDYRRND